MWDFIDGSIHEEMVSERGELICVRIMSGCIEDIKRGREFKECKG